MAADGRPGRVAEDRTPENPTAEDRDWQRLDKWLWCARFLKARATCARMIEQGAIRINRQLTDKPHARLRVGDVLTFAMRDRVLVLRVRGLARRRGPAAEARLLYQDLDEPAGAEAAPSCTAADSSAYPARLLGSRPRRGQ